MASNTYWQLEKEYYTIAEDHDLILRVIEHENVQRTEGEGEQAHVVTDSVANKVHEFKVKRDVLVDASPYFKKLLSDGGFKESQESIVTLHEDSAESLIVWFEILHAGNVESTFSTISIRGVWETLATAHKYGFDPKSEGAKQWFEGWYAVNQTKEDGKKFDFKDYQMLLFPCYTFDYAPGFASATKYLAYRATGHITERRPEGFVLEHLRLDSVIIQQTNAAKGRLKTILHRGLYNPIDTLLKRARCHCACNVLYAYEQSLSNTGAWPLESSFLNSSIQDVLRKLDGFPGPHAYMPQTCGSKWCTFDFGAVVGAAKAETRKYFDGLCLDCMNASKPKLGDADEDYWHHSKLGVHWDTGCRVRHAQPSWYFSFLGRRQKMLEWTQRSRNGNNSGGRSRGPSGASYEEVVDGVQGLNVDS